MADYPQKFEEFWKAYPRKVAKIPALTAWTKQGCEDDLYNAKAAIDDLLKRTRLGWWSKDRSKIPHPASWINAQRWHDEDWEDEIEDKTKHTESTGRRVIVPNIPTREVAWQEAMLNRIWIKYCLLAHGLQEVGAGIRIRDKMMDETVPAMDEELAAERMTKREVATTLATHFLAHLDAHYGLELQRRVLTNTSRATA